VVVVNRAEHVGDSRARRIASRLRAGRSADRSQVRPPARPAYTRSNSAGPPGDICRLTRRAPPNRSGPASSRESHANPDR